MNALNHLFLRLGYGPACLVCIQATRGSAPRDAGTWMAVFPDEVIGSIGGGQLELGAIREGRLRLARGHESVQAQSAETQKYLLGPNLGQCCGGEVHLAYERITAADQPALLQRLKHPSQPLALFGGGHVGKALIKIVGSLPYEVTWIDSRDEIFPDRVPDNVLCEHSDPVHAAVAALAPGSQVLVMSFSHAEDLDVVAACLTRQRERADLAFIGLIGSKTKWATFRHRLEARGFAGPELAMVTCPIGIEGIASKAPEVIAVAVAAQLLLKSRP